MVSKIYSLREVSYLLLTPYFLLLIKIMAEEINENNHATDKNFVAEQPATTEETTQVVEGEVVEKKTATLEEQLTQAKQESAQNLENWQRSAAELANFKRRQEEQLKRQREQIKAEVLEGVISALDDLDLAFQNVPADLSGQVVGWVEGFRLVQRKLDKVLDDQHVTLISTKEKFNPAVHEAISYEESASHEEGEIIAELRKGYQIGHRVIRPALVRVAKEVENKK